MLVTRSGFEAAAAELETSLASCDFVAIDCEMIERRSNGLRLPVSAALVAYDLPPLHTHRVVASTLYATGPMAFTAAYKAYVRARAEATGRDPRAQGCEGGVRGRSGGERGEGPERGGGSGGEMAWWRD